MKKLFAMVDVTLGDTSCRQFVVFALWCWMVGVDQVHACQLPHWSKLVSGYSVALRQNDYDRICASLFVNHVLE